MVEMQMADEDLVELVGGNAKGSQAFRRALAHVEDKLVAISKLDEIAGTRLLQPRLRHTGSTCNDSHLIWC